MQFPHTSIELNKTTVPDLSIENAGMSCRAFRNGLNNDYILKSGSPQTSWNPEN